MDRKAKYLEELRICLEKKNISPIQNIVFDYEIHIQDKAYQLMLGGVQEELALEQAVEEMLSPGEVAALYHKEEYKQVSPFILLMMNIPILFAGMLITVFYRNIDFHGVQYLWEFMVSNKWLLLFGYSLIWIATGFAYGETNGFYENSKFYQSTLMAIVPNYIFMFFILIGFQYGWTIQWFAFLLESTIFIRFCILLTIAYYPMVRVGYKLGVLRGM